MAQILEDPRNLGYSVGKGVGSGISSGLQELASKKIERLNQQHQYQEKVKGLKALRIPNAEQLAHLDDKSLQSLIKAKIEEPSNERFANSVDRIVGNEQQQPAQGSVQSLLPQSENQDRQSQLQGYLNDPEMMSQFQEQLKSPEVLQQFSPEQLAQVGERLKGFSPKPQEEPIIKAGLNQKQALDLAKLGVEKKNNDIKQNKQTLDYLAPYAEANRAAQKNDADYNLLIEAADSGELFTGPGRGLLNELGLDGFFRNYTTEAADKVIARLAQNVKSAFGSNSRITNFLEQTFQKSLPSLWNTPQGIKYIAELNKLSDKAYNVIPYQERLNVIRENRGSIPYDIEDTIDKRTKGSIKDVENQMLSVMKEAVSQSKKGDLKKASYAEEKQIPEGTIVRKKDGTVQVKRGGKLVPYVQGEANGTR